MAQLIDSVSRNFGLKATAGVVAVVLWFTFNYFGATHAGYSKTLEIPLVVRGVASGLIASTPVQRVSVELSGSRPEIDAVGPADLSAYVDCAGKQAGVYSLPVNVIGQNADKVKTVQPGQAIVAIDRYAFRTVPVVARDARGGPLTNATIVPATIQVAGAQSAVAQVVAAELSVPEPRALPVGYSAELKPVPVDSKMEPVVGATALGVVRVTGPGQEEQRPK
jgi:YbbR domain-containing protein